MLETIYNLYPVQNFTVDEYEYEKQHRILQSFWEYIKIGNEHKLSSPIFPVIFALVVDYFWVALFGVIDLFLYDVKFFKDAKIQKDRVVTWDMMKKSLSLQVWNQLIWIYPTALMQVIWGEPTELPILAPTIFELTSQVLIFFVVFDFFYFWFHFASHKIKWLYRFSHSVHHMYSSPFAASAQHMHPFELMFIGTFVTAIPWMFPTHCLTYWIWFFVAGTVSYEVHTGYDFPFALHRIFWFYSGAPAHDMHHLRPLTCFQPWFNYLDRLMGYHITYEDLRKMTESKLKKFGLYTKEDEKGLIKIN